MIGDVLPQSSYKNSLVPVLYTCQLVAGEFVLVKLTLILFYIGPYLIISYIV